MESIERTKDKDRKWRLMLYPEDPSHVEALSRLNSQGFKYIGILHNKDTNEDGTTKKEHWHIVVKFPAARYYTALAKELGITTNYIFECENFDAALLYLIHFNHKDKAEYEATECFGPLVPHLMKLIEEDVEDVRVLQIVHMIDSTPGLCSYRDILVRACNNGLYGEFRRLGAGVKYLLDEHNEEVNEQLCAMAEKPRKKGP